MPLSGQCCQQRAWGQAHPSRPLAEPWSAQLQSAEGQLRRRIPERVVRPLWCDRSLLPFISLLVDLKSLWTQHLAFPKLTSLSPCSLSKGHYHLSALNRPRPYLPGHHLPNSSDQSVLSSNAIAQRLLLSP